MFKRYFSFVVDVLIRELRMLAPSRPNRPSFRHVHIATRHALVHGLIGLFAMFLVLAADAPAMLFAVILYLGTVFAMARFTVEVSPREVTWAFGPAAPYWSLPTVAIVRAEAVRSPWYHGSGIRKLRAGWLFSAGASHAVEIEDTAGRVRRIGSDNAEAVAAAIRSAAAVARVVGPSQASTTAAETRTFGQRTATDPRLVTRAG